MNCRLLKKEDFDGLYQTFTRAFGKTSVKLQPSADEFKRRTYEKLRVDYRISAAMFDGDEMLGFILHTSNSYQGIPTAYNGGTGVLPGFRNQKTAEKLYEYLIPKIREKFIARILLEVVENNESAIKLYEKIGFHYKRKFHCYKQVQPLDLTHTCKIVEEDVSKVDFDFIDFEPSFIDSSEQLKLGSEKVLVAQKEGEILGYLIFQPRLGRISQVAVAGKARRERVGESLIFAAQQHSQKTLTIMNIPEDEVGFDRFLKRCGFENQINQFEMELII